jgi:flagellar biosynthesis protein FlhF
MPTTENNSRLYIKSYFAASVVEAMGRARVELGPDALLMNTREAPPEAKHLGECEVVFGIRPPAVPVAGASKAVVDPFADLRQRMEKLREIMCRRRLAPAGDHQPDGASGIEEELLKAGVTRALAAEIELAVQRRLRGRSVVRIGSPRSMPARSAGDLLQETIAELESRFEVAPETGRIAALVGPPGAGKTSALVKLAITRGLAAQRPVRLLSIDYYRIAAAEQLRTYAAILGVPFTLAETTAALAQAIDAAPKEALLLIDTPGYTAASLEESGQDLASFLRGRRDIDTHLVLTASMRQADLQRTVDLFQAFQPAKLLFTRLDETESTGAVFCEAARTGKPLSFLSTGQVIPEDMEPATKARITSFLVRELPQALAAVA